MNKLLLAVVLGLLIAPLAKAQAIPTQTLFLNDGGYNAETGEKVIFCFNQTECYDVKTMQRIGDVSDKVDQLTQKIDELQNTISHFQQPVQQSIISQPVIGAAPVDVTAPKLLGYTYWSCVVNSYCGTDDHSFGSYTQQKWSTFGVGDNGLSSELKYFAFATDEPTTASVTFTPQEGLPVTYSFPSGTSHDASYYDIGLEAGSVYTAAITVTDASGNSTIFPSNTPGTYQLHPNFKGEEGLGN